MAFNSTSNELFCKDCRMIATNVVEDMKQGDIICGDCGMILSKGRLIDAGSEWRNFADDSGDADPSRVGGAIDPTTGQMESTTISFRDGRTGQSAALLKSHKMATDNDKSLQAIREGWRNIQIYSERAALSRAMIDMAKELYFLLSKSSPTKSADEAGVAACIMAAAKLRQGERTFKEISALTSIPVKAIGKRYKVLLKIIEEQRANPANASSTVAEAASDITREAVNVASMIPRFANLLDLSPEARTFAKLLTERVEASGVLAARQPTTVAGTCLLVAVALSPKDSHVKAKKIGDVVGIQPSTLQKSHNTVVNSWEKLIKPEEMPAGFKAIEAHRSEGLHGIL
ncbi:hypothetical protein SmJEL517_g00139 [Synchytrium microbalum]|uniref:General transcription factor TFIIB n=1 Tax=Synchytrium microbalum TaxID=1806994 RepID=A0A507CF96_9FUNG|nr:uncharacterized protein SmJEL517_g00139 [Synchytrium microbalum]TPX38302.1 hypothetical protein SmJEL517_g00139 [Synchytrium microbalum]